MCQAQDKKHQHHDIFFAFQSKIKVTFYVEDLIFFKYMLLAEVGFLKYHKESIPRDPHIGLYLISGLYPSDHGKSPFLPLPGP